MSEKDYYASKIAQIKTAIFNHEVIAAEELLKTELGLPYIPREYEDELTTLMKEVQQKLVLIRKPKAAPSSEEIFQLLNSSDKTENAMALGMLGSLNLHLFKRELKQRLETWTNDRALERGTLLEMMTEQRVDVEVILEKYTYNPRFEKPLSQRAEVLALHTALEQRFFQNPSMLELARVQLNKYLLINFPSIPASKHFIDNFAFVIKHQFDTSAILVSEEQHEINRVISSI